MPMPMSKPTEVNSPQTTLLIADGIDQQRQELARLRGAEADAPQHGRQEKMGEIGRERQQGDGECGQDRPRGR